MKKVIRTFAVGIIVVSSWTLVNAASGNAEATNAAVQQHQHHGQISPAKGDSTAITAPADTNGRGATSPEALLKLLGERIVAKDLDGIVALQEPEAAIVDWDGSVIRGHKEIRAFYAEWFKSNPVLTVNPLQVVIAGGRRVGNKVKDRSASVMGDYTLEQDAPDGGREKFTGNFCDIVREQPDGTWLYVQDNPYPPHH